VFNGNVYGKVMFDINIKSLPLLGSVQTLIVEVPAGAQTGDLAVITADSAQTRVTKALEPFEGSAEEMQRVVTEAEQRAQDLRALLEEFNDYTVPGAGRARNQRDQLAQKYADIL
jgi:hypothetical protein